ncbi:hypothetical protein FZEAL_680 [Fusarium zealandicum]|uniref:3'-5' exonuclease domain-containing protein n=1 Tax=Fusarium zealandicum TaxID=1053134 RepID=A0A8H4UUJ0_9HYPO|nr:hypothetical protein FZEAL_680 [Fusarium zealandicum]
MPDDANAPLLSLVSTSQDVTVALSSDAFREALFIGLEGWKLSRTGTISILTIFNPLRNQIWLFDIQTLGHAAFSIIDPLTGSSLKSILEDASVPKYFWDVRNDSDAIWALYGIALAGVTDIQLLEIASRHGNKMFLSGLDKAVQHDGKIRFVQGEKWLRIERKVRTAMNENVFSSRPLDPTTMQYCINDVVHLPKLKDVYLGRISEDWRSKAIEESRKRVDVARLPSYNTHSPENAVGPWPEETYRAVSLDEFLNITEDQRIELLSEELFGHDIGYYDDDWEDGQDGCNDHDGAVDSEAFASC